MRTEPTFTTPPPPKQTEPYDSSYRHEDVWINCEFGCLFFELARARAEVTPVVRARSKRVVCGRDTCCHLSLQKTISSAQEKQVASADRKSAVGPEIPQALWTQWQLLRGRRSVDNDVRIHCPRTAKGFIRLIRCVSVFFAFVFSNSSLRIRVLLIRLV